MASEKKQKTDARREAVRSATRIEVGVVRESVAQELIRLFEQSNFPTSEPRTKARLTRLVYA